MKFLMEVYNPQTTSWDKDGNEKLVANLDYAGAVAQYGYVSSGVGFAWKSIIISMMRQMPILVITF